MGQMFACLCGWGRSKSYKVLPGEAKLKPSQSPSPPADGEHAPRTVKDVLTTVDDVAGKSFDYIIVGGGTAGLVLANRLSEDPGKSVLVLEAGGAHLDDPMVYLPASYGKFFGNEEYDWAFTTVPQEHAEGTIFPWARGKGLGGSSAGNYYLWTRPSKEDIDAWERLGNPGWNWGNFLKYSMKAERFIPASEEETKTERLTYDPAVHGTSGPIVTAFPNMRPGYDILFQDTLEELGIPRLVEPQGGDRIGIGMDLSTVDPRTNRRVSSIAYVEEAAARPNLKILVRAHAARVTGESGSDGFVASGAEFIVAGKTHTVYTTLIGEVILSAGAIKSPQILELSGIGDPDILAGIGIETKVELPAVGTNVQDHLFCGLAHEMKSPEKYNTIDALADPTATAEQLTVYAEGRGLFTLGIVGVMMCPLSAISDRAKEIEENAPSGSEVPGRAEQYAEQVARLKQGSASCEFVNIPGFYSFPDPPIPGAKHISLNTMLNRPFSRGTIHAASSDPLAAPTIDPRHFEQKIDLLTLIEQVKFVRKLAKVESLRPIVGREINPGLAAQTDEEIALWIKKYMTTVYHTCGSCSMLPRDKGGVVDPQLRVYGTKRLRVVDLSVVPIIPAAHTQSVVYALAEQASDIIKNNTGRTVYV